MATFRQRGNSWQAIVKHKSLKGKSLSKSFPKKALAEKWAKDREAELQNDKFLDERPAQKIKMSELLIRYLNEEVSKKTATTKKNETYRINALLDYVGDKIVTECDDVFWYEFGVARREKDQIAPDTLIKDLQSAMSVYEVAKMIWKIPIKENPVPGARKMLNKMRYLEGANRHHERRVTENELEKIKAYKPKRFSLVKQGTLFCIETGMRRSEVTNMVWSRVNFNDKIYHLDKQKSDHQRRVIGRGRDVPLSPDAISILKEILKFKEEGLAEYGEYIWPWRDPGSFSQAFGRMRDRLGLKDIRLHDNRHEFGSKEADKEIDMRKVAKAMGHSDLRSVWRYMHPDMKKYAEEMAKDSK